jgi:hypothetical protein
MDTRILLMLLLSTWLHSLTSPRLCSPRLPLLVQIQVEIIVVCVCVCLCYIFVAELDVLVLG